MTVRALESEWSKQRLEAMWALKEGSYLEESFNSWLFPLEIPTVQSMRTQARAQAVIFTELRQQWWKSGAPRASRSWGEPSEWKQSRRESLKFNVSVSCRSLTDPWTLHAWGRLPKESAERDNSWKVGWLQGNGEFPKLTGLAKLLRLFIKVLQGPHPRLRAPLKQVF